VPTSTAAFAGIGRERFGPVLVTSIAEFDRTVGAAAGSGFLLPAVRGFFQNGGRRCYVAAGAGHDPLSDALALLEGEDFSLLCCPDEHHVPDAASKLIAFCECRQNVVAILQPEPPIPPAALPRAASSYATRYYPWLVVPTPDGENTTMVPPGGHVAGVLARTDIERGVHKSPDGARMMDVLDVSHAISRDEATALVNRGVNVIRHQPDRGTVLFGARTASPDSEWKYLHVRRVLIFLEESIRHGLQWAVFEPNSSATWVNVARVIEDFLVSQWQHGVLAGASAETAFFVRCDQTTMTQADLDAGRFVAIVGVAPLRPAEFIILRFMGQTARRPDDPLP
jgi:phage tail sheath protein FI